jgi:potassium efflux system protein
MISDNYGSMLSSLSQAGLANSGTTPAAPRSSFLSSRSLRLLLVVLAISPAGFAQTSTTAKADVKASGKATPAKPSNPIAAVLHGKPVVPTANQPLPAAIPEPAPSPTSIPLPEVAARSQELGQMLRDLSSQLPTPEQLNTIRTSLAELQPELQSKKKEVDAMLSSTPNSLEVREQETYWRGMQSYTDAWQSQLLTWANNAQAAIQKLNEQEAIWAATLRENQGVPDLDPVIALISDNLSDIRKLRAQAKDELQTIVTMQIQASACVDMAGDALDRLAQARKQLTGHLLNRDSLPLWRIANRREAGEIAPDYGTINNRKIAIEAFFYENAGALIAVIFLLVVSQVVAYRLHVLVRERNLELDLAPEVQHILSHWFALGLLPPLMFGYALVPSAPISLIGLVILISFIPILTLLPPFLEHRFRAMLRILVGFSAANAAITWIPTNAVHRRELHFIANALLFAFFVYALPPLRARLAQGESILRRLVLLGVWLAVGTLGVALAADLFGYVRLSQFLAAACLYSAFIGISAFTAVKVFKVLFLAAMNSPFAERIAVVRLHRNAVTRWIPRLVAWAGVLIWLTATLDLLSLSESLSDVINRVLDFHIAGSAAGITLGGVLGFFLILLIGYFIANAIRFGLREEILKRFQLSRGLPELISSTLYYVILLLVVLSAINVGGIELNKFTVLTGAIGVGFGFGLQNIINNFVSGLILQFERPIHINDIIEVDGNTGKVTRIGVRSSTIQTFQGAEVIVPNASLISSKVINWTLSESQRRRELPVGVAYGSDPKIVLKILREAAAKHELVLTQPEPMVYFKGFGESSLDFELHFWVMQENNGLQITSEVALAAMQKLNDAGIEIPFPQRDLHVRSIDPVAASVLPTSEPDKRTPDVESAFDALAPEARRSRVTGD